jgi:hypothetical protein
MAVEQEVRYTLTLKDLLTGQINNATTATNGLSSAMNTARGVLGALGIGFTVFKGLETVKSGIEAFERLHQAEAQVEAGLKSTGYAAGLTAQDLEEMAKKTSSGVKYSRSEITELQSLMLTFPAITKKTFPEATQTILDMYTRLGQDTKSSAIQLGKALQDPIRGVTALRRVGVNFSEAQTDMIEKMVNTGQSAKAQALILKELQVEFGGSAKAAFDADPLAQYNKLMGSVKMGIGELAMDLLTKLKPALLTIGGLVKDSVTFFKEHKTEMKAVGVALGVLAGAFIAVNIPMWATAAAEAAVTAGMYALSLAMSVTPLGWFIIGLAAVSAGLYYAYQKSEAFRGIVLGVWEVIKGFGDYARNLFVGLGEVIMGAIFFNPEMIKKGIANLESALGEVAKKAAKGYNEGVGEVAKKAIDKKPPGAAPPAITEESATKGTKAGKTPKAADVTGQKVYTINIKIDSLIKEQNISTTTIREGASKIKDMVTEALLAAVNDSQMIAER